MPELEKESSNRNCDFLALIPALQANDNPFSHKFGNTNICTNNNICTYIKVCVLDVSTVRSSIDYGRWYIILSREMVSSSRGKMANYIHFQRDPK